MLLFLLFVLFPGSFAQSCSWIGHAMVYSGHIQYDLTHQAPTMLTDLSIPTTLTIVESYNYTDCDYTMTATQSVSINGTIFTADTTTFTFSSPSQPLLITFQYSDVTITSLTASETLSATSRNL